MANRKPAETFHPGEYITEEMEARGLTVIDMLSRLESLNWNQNLLRMLLGGYTPLTDRMAEDVAGVFGQDAQTWKNLQRASDTESEGA